MNTMSKRAPALAALIAAAGFSFIVPGFVTPVLAQAPSDAQKAAIRSACRSDYIAHCSSVTPGGIEALQCLQKNMSSLAPGCQSAVRAVEPKAEAKPEEKPAAEAKPEAKPGAPAAATAAPAEKPAAEAPAKPEPKAATEAAPAAAPKKATDAQRAAVRAACRNDYMANCSSVTPGGAAAVKCLVQHESSLSPRCKQAVAAISGGAAPAAAGAPADTATAAPDAAPAAAPLVLRPMLPREALFVLRSGCAIDARALCAGVPPGGGRILQCLASQPASLSPACMDALSPFAR
jgi:outer membrane biosynthesis protein TonB